MNISLIVPTLNAGDAWPAWIQSVKSQNLQPDRIIVIDSGSTDGTRELATREGLEVISIAAGTFNHGGTRQLAVNLTGDECDIVVFLTQDAILADSDSIARLISSFSDPCVGAAYGRQLPASNASVIAEHARLFNYPTQSRTVRPGDHSALGFKACFLSNSFAAYRTRTLSEVGGFPTDVILGEDTSVAAKMLLAGRSIHYEATARAYHSHNYSLAEEFRRYFDTGVFHSRSYWLLETFGGASGEGRRFVQSEIRYLTLRAPWLIPSAILRTFGKLVGYRLGRFESRLPLGLKRRFSMFRFFWSESNLIPDKVKSAP